MRIVMTFAVRDEADVLDLNLRIHRALGVDHYAVVDNGSIDGTLEILERWEAAGLAHVERAPQADTDEVFHEWQTRLARIAANELAADWVINNDADEFWWPLEGDLRQTFSSLPNDAAGVLAPRLEFVPRPNGPDPFWERLTHRETRTRVLPKLAHRATADLRVGPGSHYVLSADLGISAKAGKPSLRGLRQGPSQPPLIAPAAVFPCAIFHIPLRSFEQWRSRLEIGLRIAETRSSEDLGERIQQALSAGEAEARWQELVFDDGTARDAVAAGELVQDMRLRDLARRLDLEAEPGDVAPLAPGALDAAELEAARAETAREALIGFAQNHSYALGQRDVATRGHQASRARVERLIARRRADRQRARQRRQKLRRRLQRERRRRREIEASRWWRLRPRIPRWRSRG